MRKHYLKMLCLLLFFALSAPAVLAQTGSVSGRVVDETNQPLPGASVAVKGQNKTAGTDENGNFKLSGVPAGAQTIVVTYIGYQTLEKGVQVSGDVTVNFQLQPESTALTEVVVVGYGTAKKKDLTGSVTSVTTKDFNKGAVSTPEQLITGKVAGVQITSNGGAPGSGSRIRIRGGSSLNASNDPLIVIDGVPLDNASVSGSPNPLSFINPDDIESFNVLKDASAAAIYGSRAANGVIIITTKRGDQGEKLKVNFSTLNSLSQAAGQVDVLSADQYRDFVNTNGTTAQKALLGTANTNWQDQVFRTASASDNNISFTGGIKSLPYRLSIGYLGQDGILKTSNLKRTSGALSLSPRFLDNHLKVDMNLKGAITNSRFAEQGAIGAAVGFDPTQPIYQVNSLGRYYEWIDSDGAPNTLAYRNPLSTLSQISDKGEVKRSIGNLQLDYKFHFLPDLRANLNLGYDISASNGNTIKPVTLASAYLDGGTTHKYSQNKRNKLGEFYLNYVKEVKNIDSRFDITAGYSYQDWIRNEPAYFTIKGNGQNTIDNPVKTQNTLISYFGRFNYGFKGKYLLTTTLRRDGSSRFSENNRWGLFPSVALAWRINDESFLKNSKVVSDLKLRAGYGVTGQQDISDDDYPYLPRYVISTETAQYQFGNTYYLTYRPAGYDADIKWEETQSYNAGLDYGFLDGRISGSIDFYLKKTKDLLSVIPVPAGTNLKNEILTNVGNMENRGVELVINGNPIKAKNFNWNAGFNMTFNKNEITNLTKVDNPEYKGILVGDIAGGTGNKVQIHSVGYAPYSFYLYKQVYNQAGKPLEGVYEDLNKDGKIDENDLYRYKSPAPKVSIGFNSQFDYKNWNLGFVLRANLGNYMYNNFSSNNGAYSNFSSVGFLSNVSSSILNTNFTRNQYFSDYYIENASFLRMDNITLGYNFGKVMNQKVNIRLSASVQNAFVITNYSGLDPETQFNGPDEKAPIGQVGGGIDNNFYPRPRVYALGINLDF